MGAPLAETERRIDELHRRVLLICGGVIIATVIVASVLWLIMINPFRVLAQQARVINAQSNPEEVKVRGVQEAVEIAEAVGPSHHTAGARVGPTGPLAPRSHSRCHAWHRRRGNSCK